MSKQSTNQIVKINKVSDDCKLCPIQVIVRARPLNEGELADGSANVLSFPSYREITANIKMKREEKKYMYDRVYAPSTPQEEIYTTTVAPIIEEVLKGFNCTIFAYGQTGTGKTFTMEGCREVEISNGVSRLHKDAGIIPRSVKQIFDTLESSATEYVVKVSFLEIYNEELVDLLAPLPSSDSSNLKIFDDLSRKGMTTVSGLQEVPVTNSHDIFQVLDKGLKHRQTAETKLNKQSSRSHCIFTVVIHMKEPTPDGEDLVKIGKLNLVDLAGSENVRKSGAQNSSIHKREAGLINQSLLTLGRVITALTDGSSHIPYRESKLTRLLQDSLGGKTKTCIIATVSPSSGALEETLSTLEYALKSKCINNKPEVNQKTTQKALIKELNKEIAGLKSQVEALREEKGIFLPPELFKEMEGKILSQTSLVDVLNEQIKCAEEKCKETEQLFIAKETMIKSQYNEEIQALFEKIERKASVETENQNKTKSFSMFVPKKVQAVTSSLEIQRQSQIQFLSEILASFNEFSSMNSENLLQVKEFLQQLISNVCNVHSELIRVTREMQSSSKQELSSVSSIFEEYSNHVSSLSESYIGDFVNIIRNINGALSLHKEESDRWIETEKQRIARNKEITCSYIQDQIFKLDQIEKASSSFHNTFQSSSSAQENTISQIQIQYQEDIKSFKHQIIKSVEDMVETFSNTQSQRLSSSFSSFNTFLSTSRTDVEEFTQNVKDSVSSQRTILSKQEQDAQLQETGASSSLQFLQDNTTNTLQSFSISLQNLESQAKEYSKDMSSNVSAVAPKVQDIARKEMQLIEKSTELLVKNIYELDQNSVSIENENSLSSKIQESIDSSHTSFTRTTSSLNTKLREHIDSSENYHKTLDKSITEFGSDIIHFVTTLKADVPTGKTPVKKNKSLTNLNTTNIPNISEALLAEPTATNSSVQPIKSKIKPPSIYSQENKENKENISSN